MSNPFLRARTVGVALSGTMLLLFAGAPQVRAAEQAAASCSAKDIGDTIALVVSKGGGTVNLPPCQADNSWADGDYVDVTVDVPLRVRGAGMDLTVIGYRDGAAPGGGHAAMYFGGSGLVEISDFTLRGSDTVQVPVGLKLYSMQTDSLRIHHLRLQKFSNTALYVCDNPHSPMLIDHCEIGDQSTFTGGMYGIRIHGTNRQEDFVIPASFGVNNPNAVFVEDNVFDACYHSVSGFGTSNIVFRHNTVTNPTSYVDGHGACFDIGCHRGTKPASGTYIYEIYDNDVDSGSYPWCINIRGGTGIVTDNVLKSCNVALRLRIETCAIGTNCKVDDKDSDKGCPHSNTDTNACYQAPNQWWVWGNDYRGGGALFAQSDQGTGCIREDKEYFLRAPTSSDPIKGYEKYPYPHPLISGTPAPDAGMPSADATQPTDAGPDSPTTDAAGALDAVSTDSGSQDGERLPQSGCGCQVHSDPKPALWFLGLCVVAVWFQRSRRARPDDRGIKRLGQGGTRRATRQQSAFASKRIQERRMLKKALVVLGVSTVLVAQGCDNAPSRTAGDGSLDLARRAADLALLDAAVDAAGHDGASPDLDPRDSSDLGESPDAPANLCEATCAAGSIEEAIDECVSKGGGTVAIDACDFTNSWTGADRVKRDVGSTPIRIVGAGVSKTRIGYANDQSRTIMWDLRGSGLKEFAQMYLEGNPTIEDVHAIRAAFVIKGAENCRVHHIETKNFRGPTATLCATKNLVVDHCTFGDVLYDTTYQFYVYDKASDPWSDDWPGYFGTANYNVFFEDNKIGGAHHPVSLFERAKVVFRHNEVTIPPSAYGPSGSYQGNLDSHSPGFGSCSDDGIPNDQSYQHGGQVFEIYQNKLIRTGVSPPNKRGVAIRLRSGAAIVTNNSIENAKIGVSLVLEDHNMGGKCNAANGFPQDHTLAAGAGCTSSDGCCDKIEHVYVWGNRYTNVGTEVLIEDDAGGLRSEQEEHADYFLRAPGPKDGFAWTPYTYPHPLVVGTGGSR